MPRKKHLIVIHGRSTKPSHREKERVVTEALKHGLSRINPTAGARIGKQASTDGVKYSFVYYGDISNHLILSRSPSKSSRLTGRDPDHDNQPCEPDGFYKTGLEMLFDQRHHSKAAYNKFLREQKDKRWLDNAASVISFLAGLTGLSDKLIATATADMGNYLLTRQWGSAIRDRLQQPLKKALIAGDDICLVSHSMGCMVAYDVLWKFSRMSEYRRIQDTNNQVSKWLTLGNPLGEPGVRDNLYDADEPDDGIYPKNIIKNWVNLSAQDDFICHDPTVRDDFKVMRKKGYVDDIVDRKIYNFWCGAKATNPHKIYGYLDNPKVAQEILDWMDAS